jgi:hypothetical protein
MTAEYGGDGGGWAAQGCGWTAAVALAQQHGGGLIGPDLGLISLLLCPNGDRLRRRRAVPLPLATAC